MAPEIDALLDGHFACGAFPATAAETLIGIYAAGQLVTVSRRLTRRKPDLEQIVGASEVWAMCFRRPPPGWRLIGRWFDRDVFIALRAFDKQQLFEVYSQASQTVIEDWKELLGPQPPHSGVEVGDYLSGVFRDVDAVD